jgi:hypothetical protein
LRLVAKAEGEQWFAGIEKVASEYCSVVASLAH